MIYHRYMYDSRIRGRFWLTFHRPWGRKGYDDDGSIDGGMYQPFNAMRPDEHRLGETNKCFTACGPN